MRTKFLISALAVLFATSASAAPCRAQKAAEAGSKAGYTRDKVAAEEMEKRTSDSSDVLAKCIKGITAVTVVPTFPSLADIFAGVVDKACRVSIDKVRSALPPRMESVPVIPGLPGVPVRPGDLEVPVPVPGLPLKPSVGPVRAGAAMSPSPARSDELWKRVWR